MSSGNRIRIEGHRILWEAEGDLVWIEPYGSHSVRVRSSGSLRIDESLNWTLLDPAPCSAVPQLVEGAAILQNGDLTAEIKHDGTIRFTRNDGTVLLEEYWIDEREGTVPLRRARMYRHISSDVFRTDLYFKANRDEHFFGLGLDANDCFDLKGTTIELVQKNTKCTIPFVYSSRGYGFIWNSPSVGRAELVHNHTLWHAEASRQIDYIVVGGGNPRAVMENFTEITGRAPVLPEWAAGLWQSKLRYETQDQLLEVAREYTRRGIPLSVIVIDFFHWTQQGDWKFDPELWPDPEGMIRELDAMGIRTMISIWPTVDPRSENYQEMKEKNYLIRAERGVSVFFMFMGPETYCDVTHPDGARYIWNRARENYYQKGIKLFWLDEAEPELRPYDYDNVRYYAGNGLEVSNLYPYYYAKAFYDGLREEGEQEIVNLSRCAWLGSQRFSTVVWSGDIASTFDSLRKQLKAGLNFAMCGVPWWTTDIGGFFNGDPDDPAFRELIVRWFQFGVFCPIFRVHGYRMPYSQVDSWDDINGYCPSGGPNEVWSFGDDAYQIIREQVALRERMKPYLMEQMRTAASVGVPVMRPLFFDYPQDRRTYECGDEYLFGPDILVAPVIEAGTKERIVYLPEGSVWRSVSDDRVYQGGETVTVPVTLGTTPLFHRGDTAIPAWLTSANQ